MFSRTQGILEDQRGRNFIVKTLCIVVPVRCETGHIYV